MFLSVKERARQIANGQFTASTTNAQVTSLIDLVPEPKPATVATTKKTATKEAPAKAAASPSQTKQSKTAPPPAAVPKTTSSKATSPPEVSTPKKSSSKSKVTKEPSLKPASPKIGSPKSTSSSKVASEPKAPSTPKITSPTKATPSAKSTSSKTSSTPSKTKRSKSPPKRVDSPIEDDNDPLYSLKSACLKQVSGVTGLGGRRLAIVLKQRSSGKWYAALKDTGADKYLKMWMNKDKTFATKEEALEAYLVFATKMRNEVRWFPMSPRASSPKGKWK
ncbi:hypothetical protein BU25DRAFT_416404 [Macroventuria anomochaeta]|uniref:Uncharacterized protein n=1 Tax=Macroventuria anomochaeta TaxID=301207 RepID=A0ACB6RIV2_9PLEO|nr:uncharacterized protein BU25DRAFT_416404 [Macroventuria anomochaeta]KAF2621089.1 hypothetical protein BU25DRAFT_416404 [Macroventuria anomochaeta]